MAKRTSSAVFLCWFILGVWTFALGQETVIVETPFKPIKMGKISYPEVLKKEGIAARVWVQVSINRKGDVVRAIAYYNYYPELAGERLAENIKNWKFEPVVHKGEAINAFGDIGVVFWPGDVRILAYDQDSARISLEDRAGTSVDSELEKIVLRCTEYAERLSNAALFYVCREKIEERNREIKPSEIVTTAAGSPDLDPGEILRTGINILVLRGGEKQRYLNGYQLVRREGQVREVRFPIPTEGIDLTKADNWQGRVPEYSLKPILLPMQVFGSDDRRRFSFRLAGDTTINGKPAFILEASPKAGMGGAVRSVTIWVERPSGRIGKLEVKTDYLEGYDEVFNECRREHFKPHFALTCYYEIDKNGLLYPSRSETRVEYSGLLLTKKDLKSEAKVTYSQYKFFTVQTDHEIIRKKIEAWPFGAKKLGLSNGLPHPVYPIVRF